MTNEGGGDDDNKKAAPKGRAKGGHARRERLSPERRTEIARAAAQARHQEKQPRATHAGVLTIGNFQIPCYVLEDGKRILSQSGMISALGMSKGGSPSNGGDRLARFANGKSLTPYVSHDLASVSAPMRFVQPQGGVANGYEASLLADLCEAVLAAKAANALQKQQDHIAARAALLLGAFAKTGIIALVDEATGYQAVRPKDALQRYLEMVVRKELAAWSKKFPDEFYENIYKLNNWPWAGMSKNRYSVVAQYTRDLVYERLAPGLLQELEKNDPPDENGRRPAKLHQWLTDDVGNPLLAQHLHSLIMFQRLAIKSGYGWKRYVRMVDRVLPKKGATLELNLPEPDGP